MQRVNNTGLCVMKGIMPIINKSIIDNVANKYFDLGVFLSKRC